MSDSIILESPVFNTDSAKKAYQYGVDRLELCSAYTEGGLTPGPGLLSYLKSNIDIPIFVMIRPKGGNFVYSEDDINVMKEEIRVFSTLGTDGFVFGVLNPDGTVHTKACKELVSLAGKKPCTFHRAFDASSNLMKSLEDVIDCGFKRILTSGGKKSIEEGLSVIQKLLKKAGDRIIIMPGGGMNPDLVQPLRETGYLKEVHASCKKIDRMEMIHQNEEVQFSAEALAFDEHLSVDQQKVRSFKRIL